MTGLGWVLVLVVVLVAVDHAFLAAERRGWMRWRRTPPSRRTAGSALLGIQALFEPGAEHVVEEVRRADDDRDIAADDEPLAGG